MDPTLSTAADILHKIAHEQLRRELNFRVGDQVKVHVRIKEGDKERIQIFEGVVIAMKRAAHCSAFTVRKMSYGTGVERVFPLHSPSVEKIEVVSSGKVRRAKLFYLRGRRGKKARLKERDTKRVGSTDKAASTVPATPVPAGA